MPRGAACAPRRRAEVAAFGWYTVVHPFDTRGDSNTANRNWTSGEHTSLCGRPSVAVRSASLPPMQDKRSASIQSSRPIQC